jgi:hypothetical protein
MSGVEVGVSRLPGIQAPELISKTSKSFTINVQLLPSGSGVKPTKPTWSMSITGVAFCDFRNLTMYIVLVLSGMPETPKVAERAVAKCDCLQHTQNHSQPLVLAVANCDFAAYQNPASGGWLVSDHPKLESVQCRKSTVTNNVGQTHDHPTC